ncbi:MAG TPA: hypothetical protein VN253_01685 [Kofleriaceae bacterium]|nr:hypothetical protein [Kofleriaceae bacterium]
MSSIQQYFTIPFENVPANPAYTVWYATWTRERPAVEPGVNPPLVVGATVEGSLPKGATSLGSGTKDPLPPPPPPPPAVIISQPDYQKTVSDWLGLSRGEDE